jgi:hypothetical protein
MPNTALIARLQSELCFLVALDADTYFNEPLRFKSADDREVNPFYTQVRARRRKIEEIRLRISEELSKSFAASR